MVSIHYLNGLSRMILSDLYRAIRGVGDKPILHHFSDPFYALFCSWTAFTHPFPIASLYAAVEHAPLLRRTLWVSSSFSFFSWCVPSQTCSDPCGDKPILPFILILLVVVVHWTICWPTSSQTVTPIRLTLILYHLALHTTNNNAFYLSLGHIICRIPFWRTLYQIELTFKRSLASLSHAHKTSLICGKLERYLSCVQFWPT